MNNSELINNLIDSRSERLWLQIDSLFNVTIEQTKDGSYGCFTLGNEAIIYIDFYKLCKDSFAHELLHAQMSMKGCYIGGSLRKFITESPVLSMLLKIELGDHIGNVLEHVKIFELYSNLGFDVSKFTIDYHEHKCTNSELSNMESLYRQLNFLMIDTYLGKLFAVLCDPNPELDYTSTKLRLRKIEPKLYRISNELVEQWKQLEVENYRPAVTEFIRKLEKWVKRKKRYNLWMNKFMFDIRYMINKQP
jgi:hypothetical protein